MTTQTFGQAESLKMKSAYDEWIESIGVPIHEGYYVEDIRKLELGPWAERGCNAAFLKLAGQEGVSEARVTEIPAGQTLPRLKAGFDEIVYVLEGGGMSRLWSNDGSHERTFEWSDHAMFRLPRDCWTQLSNMRGDKPARLLHFNFMPVAMAANPDPDFFINNPYENQGLLGEPGEELFSQAKEVHVPDGFYPSKGVMYYYWSGNFFPDMKEWRDLTPLFGRGGGGRTVYIVYPKSKMTCHMSVFPSGSYKKAHRHGPGVIIVIPDGEGYSVMWEEGKEKIIVPWHEGSVFVPPNKWFHQHFSTGVVPARYLAFHSPRQFGGQAETIEDRARDQIEYPDEEPMIRELFQEELAKKGLASKMPEDAYLDPNYEWGYTEEF